MNFDSDNAVLVMTHLKLGDFLVMTPHLQMIQKLYSKVTVAIPDFLFSLYKEQNVLERIIKNTELDLFVQQNSCSILNLTFPLLGNFKADENHFMLNGEPFRKLQHVFKSYEESLKEYFPKLPSEIPQKPYLIFDGDPCVYEKWLVKPFSYFTVHSGSDYAPKNWDPKNFEDVITEILIRYPHLECLSLVGPSDQSLFQNRTAPKRFKEIRDDLRSIAHLLSGSLFHVDNDSGIHHLAGAMDIPSITIFGITGPGTWSSLTKKNFIHWGVPNCPNPCDGHKLEECNDRVCLTSTKVGHVLASANRILLAY